MVAVGPAAIAAEQDSDRLLGEVLADLARLIPRAELVLFRDTLKDARAKKHQGPIALGCQMGPGRVTDAWVDSKLRAHGGGR